MMKLMICSRFVILLVCVTFAMAGTAFATGGSLSANAGLVGISDEVGDAFSDGGINLGLEGHIMAGNISFGGGLGLAPLSSNGLYEEFVSSVAAVTLHGALRFYPIIQVPGPRFFVGGVFGFGALAWEYDDYYLVNGEDSDGIGFYFFGPEGGLELWMAENFFVQGKARYLLATYADETTEDVEWNLDGGDMLVIEVGVGVGF